MEKPPRLNRLLDFFYSIGLPPVRILQIVICLAVVGLVTSFIYFTNFGGDDSGPKDDSDGRLAAETAPDTSDSDTKDTATESATEAELSVDQQLDELSLFAGNDKSFFTIASEIEKRNKIVDQLQQNNQLTASQQKKATLIKLGNHQTLVIKMLSEGIEADKEMQTLEQFCNSMLEHEDPELREIAGHKLAMAAATKFTLSPTEQGLQQVNQVFATHKQSFLNNMDRVKELYGMFQRARIQHPKKLITNDAIKAFSATLVESELPEISQFGSDLGELALFAKFELATLANRIRYRDRGALDDLDGAMRMIESHPEVRIQWWKKLMHCSESLLSTERFDDAATANNIMGQLVANLADSDERKSELLEMLERQKKRASAVGSPFDVSGTLVQGGTLRPSSSEFSLVIFVNRSGSSREILRELTESGGDTIRRFRPIISFKDEFTDDDRQQFEKIPPNVIVVSYETSQKFAAAYPPDFYPYAILIDKEGKLVCQNVSLIQAANRIAKFEARERRMRNQLDSSTP